MNDGITNFCPHVPAGEPPCAACRGDDEPGEMDSLREQVAACGRLLDTQAAEIERLRAWVKAVEKRAIGNAENAVSSLKQRRRR